MPLPATFQLDFVIQKIVKRAQNWKPQRMEAQHSDINLIPVMRSELELKSKELNKPNGTRSSQTSSQYQNL